MLCPLAVPVGCARGPCPWAVPVGCDSLLLFIVCFGGHHPDATEPGVLAEHDRLLGLDVAQVPPAPHPAGAAARARRVDLCSNAATPRKRKRNGKKKFKLESKKQTNKIYVDTDWRDTPIRALIQPQYGTARRLPLEPSGVHSGIHVWLPVSSRCRPVVSCNYNNRTTLQILWCCASKRTIIV